MIRLFRIAHLAWLCLALLAAPTSWGGDPVSVTLASDPAGIVSDDQETTIGAEFTPASAPESADELHFYGWYDQTGLRLQTATGTAQNPPNVTVFEPLTLTARYLNGTVDDDSDNVPDWFELRHFGSLNQANPDPDGDGYDLAEEYARAYDPHVAEPLLYRLVQQSTPADLFPAGESFYPAETSSVTGASRNASIDEWRFCYWSANGQRLEDELGRALDPATVLLGDSPFVVLTARYEKSDCDTDGDLLPDWFEWHYWGNLTESKPADGDADGLDLTEELTRDCHPRLTDTLSPGGIILTRSSAIDFIDARDAVVTIASEPPEIRSAEIFIPIGEETTFAAEADYGDLQFCYWLINGIAQRQADGQALRNVTLTVPGDINATMVLTNRETNSDEDPIPDWFKLFYYGSLTPGPLSDSDGDGLTLLEEYRRLTNPLQPDEPTFRVTITAEPESALPENEWFLSPDTPSWTCEPLFGTIDGQRFAYWSLNDQRLEDNFGRALDPPQLTISTTMGYDLTAHFFPAEQDLDEDRVPDWFEWHFLASLGYDTEDDADGDGLPLDKEAAWDTHPRLADRLIPGGTIRARSSRLDFIDANDAEVVTSSLPADFIERSQFIPLGQPFVLNAEESYGDYVFVCWTLDGIEQRLANGLAINPVNLTITAPFQAVALLIPRTEDQDEDGVPDWFELRYLGHLDNDGESDSDQDGLPLLEEWHRQTNPLETDEFTYRVTEEASPAGLFPATTIYYTSDNIGTLSRNAFGLCGEQRFTHWSLNGTRQEDWLGRGLDPALLEFGSDSAFDLTAHFTDPEADEDQDLIPDWFEIHFLGSLTASNTFGDPDTDGYSLAEEERLESHPRLHDRLDEGGMIRTRSITLDFAYRNYFQATQTAFYEDQRQQLFASQPGAGDGSLKVDLQSAPALGDWDGDGDLDLFIGTGTGTLEIYENSGSQLTLNLAQRQAFSQAFKFAETAALYPVVADWDGDGNADLAIGTSEGTIHFFRGNGSFDLDAGTPTQTPAFSLHLGDAAVRPAFLDGDGDQLLDLLVLGPDGTLSLYPNSPDAEIPFSTINVQHNVAGITIPNATGFACADVTDDGRADLLLATDSGQIWLYQAQDTGYLLSNKVWGSTYSGFAETLSIAIADWDGDGDADLLAGDAQGTLTYLRNPTEHLTVQPAVQSLMAGESIQFSCSEVSNGVWEVSRCDSGGTIDPNSGLYQAGNKAGVDCIRLVSTDGRTGLAWVRVMPPEVATAMGQAIIVAGRLSSDDYIAPAVSYLADTAWDTLRGRGLRTIQYLGFDSENDNISAQPTNENLLNALVRCCMQDAPLPSLLLYLVDHGRLTDDQGPVFYLNENESCSASELSSWLDFVHVWHPETVVSVVLECCYAGNMAEVLRDSQHADKRILIAAAAENELTHYISGGRISFSHHFWSNIAAGLDLSESFADAAQAMATFQTAQINVPASLTDVFATQIDGLNPDRPQIAEVSPPQELLDTTSAHVWVRNAGGPYPIDRVWAVIVPPSYTSVGVNPVIDLPEAELAWNEDLNLWEGDLTGLSEGAGKIPYTIMFYAQDIWGGVSYPSSTTILQQKTRERVVILVADGDENATSWTSLGETALAACLYRRINREDILLLDHFNPTPEEMYATFQQWPKEAMGLECLTIYLVGEGAADGLLCADGARLTPENLKQELDLLQGDSGCRVNLIVEADYSGIFLATSNPDYPRTLMTSTGTEQPTPKGTGLSKSLWERIARGDNLQQAFAWSLALARAQLADPLMRMDDDGNGRHEAKAEGYLAVTQVVGTAFGTGAEPPTIGRCSPILTILPDETFQIWVSDITTSDGRKPEKVWADISEPDRVELEGQLLQTTQLAWNDSLQSYTAELNCVDTAGQYVATVYAGTPGKPDQVSSPAIIQINCDLSKQRETGAVDQTLPVLAFDTTLPLFQVSVLEPLQFRFQAAPGSHLNLTLKDFDNEADLKLEILNPWGRIMAAADDWGRGLGERIWNWQPTEEGWYLVRISSLSGVSATSGTLLAETAMDPSLDAFENDDTPAKANALSLLDGHAQTHNFHDAGDLDWLSFGAQQGISYEFEIYDQEALAAPCLAIFQADGTSLLQDYGPLAGSAQSITWVCPASGQYYLRLANQDPTQCGLGTGYTFRSRIASGSVLGYMYGRLSDADGNPLAGELLVTDGPTLKVSDRGTYFLAIAPGIYQVTAQCGGYQPQQWTLTVQANQAVEQNLSFSQPLRGEVSLPVSRGWNLISLPLKADANGGPLLAQLPHGVTLWAWDADTQTYHNPAELLPKTGYWLYSGTETSLKLTGEFETLSTASLRQGWNLVGPLEECPLPDDRRISCTWSWENAQYRIPACFNVPQGYWLHLSAPSVVRLGR
jgi:hypothetical protein